VSPNDPSPESQLRRAVLKAARRARATEIGSFSAVIFSLLALVTAIYQTRLMQSQTELMQTQSRASVWPYVSIGENDTRTAGQEAFTWRVDNNGVGPAKINSVVVMLDGQPYKTWKDIFHVLLPDEKTFRSSQTSINGTVQPPSLNRETTVEMIKLDTPAFAKAFLDAMEKKRFQMEICYCSVYDECWTTRISSARAAPVPRCETEGTVQFDQ
jgi:hypothetical protein